MPYELYSCIYELKTEWMDGQTFFISNRYLSNLKYSTARSFVIVLIFVKPHGWKVIQNIAKSFQIESDASTGLNIIIGIVQKVYV